MTHPHDSDDTGLDPHLSPPPSFARRVAGIALITLYTVIFLFVFGLGVGFSLEYAGVWDRLDPHLERIGPELFGIAYVIVDVLMSYALARWLITRHPRTTLASTFAIIALVLIGWGAWAGYGRWRVAQETRRWIELGGWVGERPVVTSDLPSERNAMTYYDRAFLTLSGVTGPRAWIDEDTGWIVMRRIPTDDEDSRDAGELLVINEPAALAEMIEQHEASVEAALEATSVPNISWADTDWKFFRIFRLIELDAEARISLGLHGTTSRHARALLAIHRHAQTDATMARFFVAREAIDLAVSIVARIGPEHLAEPEAFLTELESVDTRLMLADAVVHHASDWSTMFRFNTPNTTRDDYEIALRFGLMHLDLADWLRRSGEAVTALRSGASFASNPPGGALPRQHLPMSSQTSVIDPSIWERSGQTQRRIHLARAALQLLLHQREHGAFPANVTDLAAPLPIDPVTEQPYAYERTAAGFRLRSPQSDLIDEMIWDWSGDPGERTTVTPEPDPDRSSGDFFSP